MGAVEKTIKDLVSRVNKQLWYYERDWVSVQRYPESEKIRPQSFQEYLEIRFNFEASKVPELYEAEMMTEGRLFSCTELVDPDESKRRFKTATISLLDEDRIPEGLGNVRGEIESVRDYLGGSRIQFNSVKSKIKLNIYE